jgi:hypothetical protein
MAIKSAGRTEVTRNPDAAGNFVASIAAYAIPVAALVGDN